MQPTQPLILRVAVPSPLRRTFDYTMPQHSAPSGDSAVPIVGCRVSVSFGRRNLIGLVVETGHSSDFPIQQLKPINRVIDSTPLLPETLFNLFVWTANYYQYPIGEALFSALPVLLRRGESPPTQHIPGWQLTTMGLGLGPDSLRRAPKQSALIEHLKHNRQPVSDADLREQFSRDIIRQLQGKSLIESVEIDPLPSPSVDSEKILRTESPTLNAQQQIALDTIDLHGYHCYLLDGVTGSGKTEVYFQCIEKALRYGRQSLVLIPEISLTPQTQKRFRDRFNVPTVILHSALTDRQRLSAWEQARTGSAKIILGTRSAIFTPLLNPGLIVVDEEHDLSYKQQEGFRYSARDLAVTRAQREAIPIVLGSATPSLESLNNCAQNRYTHLQLDSRAGHAMPPNWQLVDLKQESIESGIAESTLGAIKKTLAAQKQVLVFLNRRGYAPVLMCHSCGWTAECSHCDARLTVHRARNRLICHHCDHQQRQPSHCPNCQSHQLIATGEGTERSWEYLQKCFPEYPVLRIDRDSTRKKGAMQDFFDVADSGQPCILIGTQMLAKGHHFEQVTLVVVVDADSGLFSADFRSHERFGQLLTQVAGRSGRGKTPGRVLLQTHQPQHPILTMLISQDYRYLAQQLLAQRHQCHLPPFKPMAILRAESSHAVQAQDFLAAARSTGENLTAAGSEITFLGPLPALMERRSGRYRYYLQIEANTRGDLQRSLNALIGTLETQKTNHAVRWSVDVDPQEL